MVDDFCEDNSCPHRNNPNRMSDADHGNLYFVFSGGFRRFKHSYQECVCKYVALVS